ncbi:acyl-CoA dehydrogenase family protein [Deinococcus arcticus]|uniref:Acyl-CoA dehydrogenase n=1 Tax=Deinococcus arcticus TaxID=2136176 RepID=A0A2T3W5R4_9DEIO|nr:acyl-CoA dehydrogenase family protein [Deinococcus arcticus]PTA67212.1 acyl-CoA dehydrogenase [Deinococcus arcticus]
MTARAPLNQDAVLGLTAEVARGPVQARARQTDEEARWPGENLRALQAAGLGGLVVPAALGGLGHGLHTLTRVCELLGQHCASSAITFGMHHVGAAVMAAKATPAQQARYLGPICAGEHLTTLALSEPGTGAHFYYPQLDLRARAGGGFEANGTKTFVTNGAHADSYVVSARSQDADLGDFSCFVLPEGTPGMTWGEPWAGLGMRGNSARRLELRGVQVPASDLLGAVGDQIWYVFNVVAPYFLMAMTGTYLGVADAALREAISHLKARTYSHSGRTAAQENVLQYRVGGLWSELERTRQLAYAAAQAGDAGDPAALPALLSCKAAVADTAVLVVNEAMSLMGGVTYRDGSALDRHLRDVRAAPVMSPTTDLLRLWTGRALLDQPLLGE